MHLVSLASRRRSKPVAQAQTVFYFAPAFFLLIGGLIACQGEKPSVGQDQTYAVQEERTPVHLGQTRVELISHEAEVPGRTYLNLHDDENTAVEAALASIQERGGRLVEIQHTGERNLSFELEGTTYTFDPNRIFTDKGAEATLRDQGPYAEAALEETRRFARLLLEEVGLDTLDLITTIHNNTEGNYSAQSYTEGETYAGEAEAVHVVDGGDPDDFFFVTTQELYDHLRADDAYSVVLQDNAQMTDDGSLSVYCGMQGVDYVNVEAQHGHLEEQKAMLAYLTERLDG